MTAFLHAFFAIIMWQMCTIATNEGEKFKAFWALVFSAANGAMVMKELF